MNLTSACAAPQVRSWLHPFPVQAAAPSTASAFASIFAAAATAAAGAASPPQRRRLKPTPSLTATVATSGRRLLPQLAVTSAASLLQPSPPRLGRHCPRRRRLRCHSHRRRCRVACVRVWTCLMHRVTASPRATVCVGGSPKNIIRGVQPTSCNADEHGPRGVSGTARSPARDRLHPGPARLARETAR